MMKDREEDQGSEKEGKRISENGFTVERETPSLFCDIFLKLRSFSLSLSLSEVTVMSQIVAQDINVTERRGM